MLDGWEAERIRAVDMVESLAARAGYKAGWVLRVRDYRHEAYLEIEVETVDSGTGAPTIVLHRVAVPPYLRDERQARYWIFEQIVKAETHEAMEFFTVDGVAPYFPDHARSPYAITERTEAA